MTDDSKVPTVASLLIQYREENGRTLKDVAIGSGISKAKMEKYEQGELPTEDHILRLIEYHKRLPKVHSDAMLLLAYHYHSGMLNIQYYGEQKRTILSALAALELKEENWERMNYWMASFVVNNLGVKGGTDNAEKAE